MSLESDGHRTSESLDITLLPEDIFWMLFEYLAPIDIVCCLSVSRAWRHAFRNPSILLHVLKKCFPLAREVRKLHEDGAFEAGYYIAGEDMGTLFCRVACRYHHLTRGKPRSVQKFDLCEDFGEATGEREFFPVPPWESHASQMIRVDCHYSEAFWAYEEGLLVFPSADDHQFVLIDLESGTDNVAVVPFSITGKVIRRVRLRQRVLVIEWAESSAFHWLNETDGVHRHFACAYDVARNDDDETAWRVTFRNEWKIMFLGQPLSSRDRFYSCHTKSHYGFYVWQPNRSLYTADDDAPIESLTVMDISTPSMYRPSLDPMGRIKEQLCSDAECPRKGRDNGGPRVVSRFSFRELDFFLVRQRGLPRIQNFEITDDGLSIQVTESVLTMLPVHPLYDPNAWLAVVHNITFPVSGIGPCWCRRTSEVFPPYRGNSSLRSSRPLTAASNGYDNGNEPWFTVISEAADRDARVYFRLHFLRAHLPDLHVGLSIRTPSTCLLARMPDFYPLVAKGKIRGNERFLVGENYMRQVVVYRFD